MSAEGHGPATPPPDPSRAQRILSEVSETAKRLRKVKAEAFPSMQADSEVNQWAVAARDRMMEQCAKMPQQLKILPCIYMEHIVQTIYQQYEAYTADETLATVYTSVREKLPPVEKQRETMVHRTSIEVAEQFCRLYPSTPLPAVELAGIVGTMARRLADSAAAKAKDVVSEGDEEDEDDLDTGWVEDDEDADSDDDGSESSLDSTSVETTAGIKAASRYDNLPMITLDVNSTNHGHEFCVQARNALYDELMAVKYIVPGTKDEIYFTHERAVVMLRFIFNAFGRPGARQLHTLVYACSQDSAEVEDVGLQERAIALANAYHQVPELGHLFLVMGRTGDFIGRSNNPVRPTIMAVGGALLYELFNHLCLMWRENKNPQFRKYVRTAVRKTAGVLSQEPKVVIKTFLRLVLQQSEDWVNRNHNIWKVYYHFKTYAPGSLLFMTREHHRAIEVQGSTRLIVALRQWTLLDASEVYADAISDMSKSLAPAVDAMFDPILHRLRYVRPKQEVYKEIGLPKLPLASLALSKTTKTLEDLNDLVHRAYGEPHHAETAAGGGEEAYDDDEDMEGGE